jgi:hypothetical protein
MKPGFVPVGSPIMNIILEKDEISSNHNFMNRQVESLISKLAEAPSHNQTIFDYASDSTGAKAYMDLSNELIGRWG